MGRIGLVAGHTFVGAERELEAFESDDVAVLQRHGTDRYTPPHLIDHRANLAALSADGCDRVLAVSSVGSLRAEIGVGTVVCPDDFIALHLGYSVHDDARGHRVPGFDPPWRARVLESWTRREQVPVRDGGVYWQAIGPRFETAAEIRLIAAHADVIGMTVAAECIIAGELGLSYAAVCVVDNLANGIGAEPLTLEEYEAGRAENRDRVRQALEAVLPSLAGASA
jgi:5'-methylthioadenosine phosphorylase